MHLQARVLDYYYYHGYNRTLSHLFEQMGIYQAVHGHLNCYFNKTIYYYDDFEYLLKIYLA